jgi:hypothetical protein
MRNSESSRHRVQISRRLAEPSWLRTSIIALSACAMVAGSSLALAKDGGSTTLQSASALAFGPSGVLFVGDTRGAEIHAYQVPASDFTDQSNVVMGNARTFNGQN